eukprot:2372518-Rhodomonas_salina.2
MSVPGVCHWQRVGQQAYLVEGSAEVDLVLEVIAAVEAPLEDLHPQHRVHAAHHNPQPQRTHCIANGCKNRECVWRDLLKLSRG